LLVEKTVVLDTNTKLFMHRLEDFTKTLDQHQFPTENGGCYRLVSLIDHSQVSYLTRMLISARYSKPELETPGRLTLAIRGIYIPGSGEGREEKEVEPIQLDVETVAPERLAVTAKCDTPEVMDYFSEILRWMMKCWPEATQQLLEPGFQQELQLMISDAEQDTWKPILGTAQQPTPAAASAGDILPVEPQVASNDQAKPQADSGAVGEKGYYREPRDETKWYDEWVGKYLRDEISRKELNEGWEKWYRGLYPAIGNSPDRGPLRTAISKRKVKMQS
jgi:hypothetical protein